MTTLILGQKVIIKKTSQYFYQIVEAGNQVGEVDAIIGVWYNVRFPNGYFNHYTASDLQVVNTKNRELVHFLEKE